MRYRNVVTGAEFVSKSKISAPDWIAVGAEAPIKAESDPVVVDPVKEDPVKEDPKSAPKKTATKKAAPKKKGAKK